MIASTNSSALLASAVGSLGSVNFGNLTNAGYIATTTSGFTLDTAIPANGLYVQTTQGPITVLRRPDGERHRP